MSEPGSPYAEAIEQLRGLLEEARRRGLTEPTAATLATADTAARPSVRTVTVAAIEDTGPRFFVHRDSGKGQQLAANPRAGLCFFWPDLHCQAIVEGETRPAADDAADRLWARRPNDARLAAWLADAGELDGAAQELDERLRAARRAFDGEPVPRPAAWQLIDLHPDVIQFWRPGWRHLQARRRYVRDADGDWRLERVAPL